MSVLTQEGLAERVADQERTILELKSELERLAGNGTLENAAATAGQFNTVWKFGIVVSGILAVAATTILSVGGMYNDWTQLTSAHASDPDDTTQRGHNHRNLSSADIEGIAAQLGIDGVNFGDIPIPEMLSRLRHVEEILDVRIPRDASGSPQAISLRLDEIEASLGPPPSEVATLENLIGTVRYGDRIQLVGVDGGFPLFSWNDVAVSNNQFGHPNAEDQFWTISAHSD